MRSRWCTNQKSDTSPPFLILFYSVLRASHFAPIIKIRHDPSRVYTLGQVQLGETMVVKSYPLGEPKLVKTKLGEGAGGPTSVKPYNNDPQIGLTRAGPTQAGLPKAD